MRHFGLVTFTHGYSILRTTYSMAEEDHIFALFQDQQIQELDRSGREFVSEIILESELLR